MPMNDQIASVEISDVSPAVLDSAVDPTSVRPHNYSLVIEPPRGWVSLQLRELWEFRELLFFLAWRDVKVRYKQTVLGAAWALIQPFFTMLIFSIFFGRLAGVPSDGIEYPLFAFAALVPWTYFAYVLTQSADSLVSNANLIKKVFFPRLIIPFSGVCAGLVDFLLAFFLLLGMMAYYHRAPGLAIVFLPLFVLLAITTALGVGLWLSALNVQFRDVRYTLTFITQAWMLATPIGYPSSLLSEPYRSLYGLNPMAGVVEGFRWSLLGTANPPGAIVAISALASACILVSGAYYFRRMEKSFADIA